MCLLSTEHSQEHIDLIVLIFTNIILNFTNIAIGIKFKPKDNRVTPWLNEDCSYAIKKYKNNTQSL